MKIFDIENITTLNQTLQKKQKIMIYDNPLYKIYGERNSGTNLLRLLIGDDILIPDDVPLTNVDYINNFVSKIGIISPKIYDFLYDRLSYKRMLKIYGWKHAMPPIRDIIASNVVPVIIVKHPQFWMRSFVENPFHHHSKSKFYKPMNIELMDVNKIHLSNIIIEKYKKYAELISECGGILVQYETLVTEFQRAQASLQYLFGNCLDLPESEVRNFVKKQKKDYKYLYSNEVLKEIELIDPKYLEENGELLHLFGYKTDAWAFKLPERVAPKINGDAT